MIYFVRSGKFIKIGTSIDPNKRLGSLQTANPNKLKVRAVLNGGYKTEIGLHQLFEKSRIRGEWFRLTEEITWYIIAIQHNPDVNNIYTIYKKSQQMRLKAKAKRLGKEHKLSKKIAKYSSQ